MWKKLKEQKRAAQSLVAQRLMTGVTKLERKGADYLQQKEVEWTLRQKKRYLFLFCLVSFGASAWILVQALTTHAGATPGIMEVTPFAKPIIQQEQSVPRLSAEDTANIIAFRRMLDSLGATPEGRETLQRYFKQRPGLADSFRSVENMIK